MKKVTMAIIALSMLALWPPVVFSAYHHEGEVDSDKFLAIYPEKAGTKLDHCVLCHGGGSYVNNKGQTVNLGSCQWCHYYYGYDGQAGGTIAGTLNSYGSAYFGNGRNAGAVTTIENVDSDGDGHSNVVEIDDDRFPGNATDYPGLAVAPYRVYTKAQLQSLAQHTQFMLMNTSRSGDFYAEYTGVPMEDLLEDAGMTDSATGILVYAPDGWSNYHPLDADPDPELYHVRGTYPAATYYYDAQATAWCDYSAPSCTGRSHGDAISVSGGLKMLLVYKREGVDLDTGFLNTENKLDGEGPFRVVPPQKEPSAPDQSSTSGDQNVIWPYTDEWDHNAGSASRSATIIKVEPLPAGTTDIDVLEAGWNYVDQKKIIVYGAIDGTDSNGNGVLDSEEGTNAGSDFDGDGTPDYKDTDTAHVRHAKGVDTVCIHTSNGDLVEVQAFSDEDPLIVQSGKPSDSIPYGTFKFNITGLAVGEQVTVSLVFPDNVPTTAKYYKIHPAQGWREIPFGSNDGDNTITLTLTDGNSLTDNDGIQNGTIEDPSALTTPTTTPTDSDSDGGGGGGGCFIGSAADAFSWLRR